MVRRLVLTVSAVTAFVFCVGMPVAAQVPTYGGTVVCDNPLGATISHPSSAR